MAGRSPELIRGLGSFQQNELALNVGYSPIDVGDLKRRINEARAIVGHPDKASYTGVANGLHPLVGKGIVEGSEARPYRLTPDGTQKNLLVRAIHEAEFFKQSMLQATGFLHLASFETVPSDPLPPHVAFKKLDNDYKSFKRLLKQIYGRQRLKDGTPIANVLPAQRIDAQTNRAFTRRLKQLQKFRRASVNRAKPTTLNLIEGNSHELSKRQKKNGTGQERWQPAIR